MNYSNNFLTIISILVTSLSIYLSIYSSLPNTSISPEILASYFNQHTFSFRVLALILIELPLGFGFGYLFYLVSYIDYKKSADQREFGRVNFFNPYVLLLNLILIFLSACVTFFNIDIIITIHSSLAYSRTELLLFFGIFLISIELLLMYSHIKDRYDGDGLNWKILLGAQLLAFILTFFFFIEAHGA